MWIFKTKKKLISFGVTKKIVQYETLNHPINITYTFDDFEGNESL